MFHCTTLNLAGTSSANAEDTIDAGANRVKKMCFTIAIK